jgi:molybdenum cofactor biosynthesis enzyme MoaA
MPFMSVALAIPVQSRAVPRTYRPEEAPYDIVMVDVTHRCNMTCSNCYLPNRIIPDMSAQWLSSILRRLRKGTFIRLTGGEATLRQDLPDIIRDVRAHGHHPVVMTNGLKLADRAYVRELKKAGMQVCYLSFSGGFDDDLYDSIDEMRCAERKRLAFENLRAEHVFTSIGMILVPGVNESAVTATWTAIEQSRNVRELHLRAVGAMGRHTTTPPAKLHQMMSAFCDAAGVSEDSIEIATRTDNAQEFFFGRVHVQMTEWPDLGSTRRGRLTPEGTVAPFMEHIIANDGGY